VVTRNRVLFMAAAFALSLSFVGCAGEKEAGTPTPQAETPVAGDSSVNPEVEQALAQLSPEDRLLAEQQKTCPVGNQPLGSMGAPIKLNIDGKDVFICCAGCEDPLRANPEKYLGTGDSAEGAATDDDRSNEDEQTDEP
jgi:hypothetical protein